MQVHACLVAPSSTFKTQSDGLSTPHVASLWPPLLLSSFSFKRGFPSGSVIKNLPANTEIQVRSLGWEDPLEEGMATHSSVLAWKVPWTEEPGRPESVGSRRVRHEWSDYARTHTHSKESWNWPGSGMPTGTLGMKTMLEKHRPWGPVHMGLEVWASSRSGTSWKACFHSSTVRTNEWNQ